MADELKLSITLDTGEVVKGFLNVEKQAEKSSKKIEKSFDSAGDDIKNAIGEISPAIGSIGDKLTKALTSPIGLVTVGVTALGAAIKGSFDLALAGEKLLKIDKQFESLTQSVGIAGDKLRSSFTDSLGGLIDDSDAIEALNKSIVTLGSKAQQLPQVMELARKATNLFGGDVVSNFEAINQAIATGATRQLRGLGIIINADEAYTKYAKSIGVTKDLLSESGRQQAILNEVLEKGETKFAGVALKSDNLTESLQRLKVESNNSFEEFEKSFAKTFGPPATRLIDFMTEKLKSGIGLKELAALVISPGAALSAISGQAVAAAAGLDLAVLSVNDLKAKISESYSTIDGLNKRITELTAQRKEAKDISTIARLDNDLRSAKASAIETEKQLKSLYSALNVKLGPEDQSTILPQREKTKIADDSVDQKLLSEATMKREKELTDFLLQQNQARLNSKIQTNVVALNNTLTNAARLQLTEENLAIQDKLREEQKNQQIAAIKLKYKDDTLNNKVDEKIALQAIEDNFAQQQIQAEQNRFQQLKLLNEQSVFEQTTGFQTVLSGFQLMSDGMNEVATRNNSSLSKQFKDLGETIFTSVGSRVGSAFQAFGSALRKGEDAGQAFVNVMGKQIADIASQIGNFFIQAGIARIAASYGADTTGYVMVGAGAALNIIGGLISASIGSGGGGAGSADTGGGTAATPATATTELAPAQKAEPNTNVQLIVQGSIYDSDETSSRLFDLLNTGFDKKGLVLQKGVSA